MLKKNFDLEAYKKTISAAQIEDKKRKFIVLDDCLHAVLGMPGIPLGHITQIYGPSDTGKTSLMFHSAAQAQKQGILPVLIITERKVSWERAEKMGFDKDNAIIIETDEYLEDVFSTVDRISADANNGNLPTDVCIFVDSIGNTLSRDEVIVNKDGTIEKKATMMKAAKVISESMRVASKKINDTTKVTHPNYVGLVVINQCYTKPASFPGGMSTLVPYGGKAIWYSCSLVLNTKKRQKLTSKKDGQPYNFGIVSKITVEKNHVTDVSHTGEFVITADSIIPNEPTALKAYKDEHKSSWGEIEVMENYDES